MGNTVKTARLPKGKYFIGDPCYVIRDEEWTEVGNATGWFGGINGSEKAKAFDGTFMTKNGVGFADGTAHGDGCYMDAGGELFIPVDSGLIGIVPVDDNTQINPYLGQVLTFKEDFNVCSYNGNFLFDTYVIGTWYNKRKKEL